MQIHHLQGHIQSIYLVEYPDRLLLLDGCCRADIATLKTFITAQLNRPFSDLRLILVTHMHPDHAGAAHVLRRLSGCKIASANKDSQWYRGLNGILMHLIDIALATWVADRMGKSRKNLWYSRKLKADYLLNDGELVPGFSDWQILETPGHTDRDLSILHVPSRKVYVADLMVKVKKRYIPPFPVFHPNKYRASIQKMINLQPSSILLAHGAEVELSDEDYQHLMDCAPEKPKTVLRAMKLKTQLMLKRST